MGLDRYKRILNRGRTIVDNFGGGGLRPYTVTSRIEVYNQALQHGATIASLESVITLSPNPKVEQLTGEKAVLLGAGEILEERGGEFVVTVFEISNITPSYATGGYTLDQLFQPVTLGTTKRHVILLDGPGLSSGGEPFKVILYDVTKSLNYKLTVKRVPRY